jgi:hypothetical protein
MFAKSNRPRLCLGANYLRLCTWKSVELGVMDMDELRDTIWEYLFRAKEAKPINEIVMHADRDDAAVRAAVNHEWFEVAQDRVSIAYTAPPRRDNH